MDIEIQKSKPRKW